MMKIKSYYQSNITIVLFQHHWIFKVHQPTFEHMTQDMVAYIKYKLHGKTSLSE